jgi:hypothetical protein
MSLAKYSDAERGLHRYFAPNIGLLHFCFFARRDDFGVHVVGQADSLRPIVNRPNVANVQHSSFAARRYVGQVGNLRPIVNRPTFGGGHYAGGRPSRFAACRYAGQVANLRPIANRPKAGRQINPGEWPSLTTSFVDRQAATHSPTLVLQPAFGRLTIGRRLPTCPTKSSQRAKKQECSKQWTAGQGSIRTGAS